MILETLIPPAQPEAWYRKDRACARCEARILYRKESPPRIIVRHEKGCLAVLETKRGSVSR